MRRSRLFLKPVAQRGLAEPLPVIALRTPERDRGTAALRDSRPPRRARTGPPRREDQHAQRAGWGRRYLYLAKLALFILLGAADVYLTWQLVQAGGGQVYEVNPLAAAWLQAFGWVGLLVFKALAMLLVGGSILYVSRYRPRTGDWLLTFACSATGLVVGYSCYLALHTDAAQTAATNDIRCAEQRFQLLDRELDRQRQHRILLRQLGTGLATQQLSLDEAVHRLAQTDRSHDPRWLDFLHRAYPDCSTAECLALHLMHWTLRGWRHDFASCQRLASRLEAEYQATYGREVHVDLSEDAAFSRRPPAPVEPTEHPAAPWLRDRL